MKKIALFAIVCCAMVFTSCNRDQHSYYTTTNFNFANHDNEVSAKAVLGTINLYWDGEYTFTGNDEAYTDVRAEAKYIQAKVAILAHGNELKAHMDANDYFYYNLYRKDNTLLEKTKFYIDADGDFDCVVEVDNVEGEE